MSKRKKKIQREREKLTSISDISNMEMGQTDP